MRGSVGAPISDFVLQVVVLKDVVESTSFASLPLSLEESMDEASGV